MHGVTGCARRLLPLPVVRFLRLFPSADTRLRHLRLMVVVEISDVVCAWAQQTQWAQWAHTTRKRAMLIGNHALWMCLIHASCTFIRTVLPLPLDHTRVIISIAHVIRKDL